MSNNYRAGFVFNERFFFDEAGNRARFADGWRQIEICTLNGCSFMNLYPFDMFFIPHFPPIQAYFRFLKISLKVRNKICSIALRVRAFNLPPTVSAARTVAGLVNKESLIENKAGPIIIVRLLSRPA